jgi:rhamnosyltransferase
MVSTLASVYEEFPEKENLAIIGSNYKDSNGGNLFISTNRDDQRSWQEVKTVITSGSLLSLAAYSALGPFREEFFMDCVDLEYCLRARSHGFRIIVTRKPLMDHALGATTMHRLPWKRTGTSNHLPVRRYYMTRNLIVLVREYLRKEPVWAMSTLYSRLKSTILICLFEKNKFRKLGFTAIGIIDGLFSNFRRNPS